MDFADILRTPGVHSVYVRDGMVLVVVDDITIEIAAQIVALRQQKHTNIRTYALQGRTELPAAIVSLYDTVLTNDSVTQTAL